MPGSARGHDDSLDTRKVAGETGHFLHWNEDDYLDLCRDLEAVGWLFHWKWEEWTATHGCGCEVQIIDPEGSEVEVRVACDYPGEKRWALKGARDAGLFR